MVTTDNSRLFNERLNYWASTGLYGADLYEAMATDNHLPSFFGPEDLAAIEGVQPASVKKSRHRRSGPPFMRMTAKIVKYPRPDYCRYLAPKFVRREAA